MDTRVLVHQLHLLVADKTEDQGGDLGYHWYVAAECEYEQIVSASSVEVGIAIRTAKPKIFPAVISTQTIEDSSEGKWNGQENVCDPKLAAILFEEPFEVKSESS